MSNINNRLIDAAIEAAQNAYAPYSKFKVGAVLLMKDGSILKGANIENASFGLCNCAERTVLFYAYAQGYRKEDIQKLAVVADTPQGVSPCGACRQVMSELLELECPIILSNINKTDIKETNIKELLPYIFTSDSLSK